MEWSDSLYYLYVYEKLKNFYGKEIVVCGMIVILRRRKDDSNMGS